MRKGIIIILLIITILFISGCNPLTKECQRSYNLNYSNSDNLLKENVFHDNGTIGYRFFKEKRCLDGSTPKQILIGSESKYCTDCGSEAVYYCETDNNYIVVKHFGEGAFSYYFFDGNPCK